MMRRNLYNRRIEIFLRALKNLGWKEETLHRDTVERHFRKGGYHLILKNHSAGHYCVMHKDRFLLDRKIHMKPVTKSDELVHEYKRAIAEYKRLRF